MVTGWPNWPRPSRERRDELVAPVLAELGAWDLNPRSGADEAEAAAALCRSAGYWAVAYPVAERLSRPRDVEADGLVVVNPELPAAPVAGPPPTLGRRRPRRPTEHRRAPCRQVRPRAAMPS